MSIVSVKADAAYTEEELKEWIRTQEATFGEIARIGIEDAQTCGSFHRFDPAHPRPTVEADFKRLPSDAPDQDGELCRGVVLIEEEEDHIVVFRPDA